MTTHERLSIPSGTSDIYGAAMWRRNYVIDVIRRTYEQYGFQPLHTPALEHADVFNGHHGAGEQLLFRLADKKGVPLVLRYDLTVPLARVVSMYSDLPSPFRRYQLASAFRDDDVDRGHFREFMQCDGDTVGIADLTADAEVITMACMGLKQIGFGTSFTIRINHRGIIKGLTEYVCGSVEHTLKIQEALDYADKTIKCGVQGVRNDLLDRGIDSGAVERLVCFLDMTKGQTDALRHAEKILGKYPDAKRGIDELKEIIDYLPKDILERISIDFTLARGANYYTGFILEGVINDVPVGAVLGGGRYDNLVAAAGGDGMPAVGMAFGLERILTVMDELEMSAENYVQVALVYAKEESGKRFAFRFAHALREEGVAIEFNPEIRTQTHATEYANARNYGVVVACDRKGDFYFDQHANDQNVRIFAQKVYSAAVLRGCNVVS